MTYAPADTDVTGLILAGGRSRRFGNADKAVHLVDGRRMIDRVADAVGAVTGRILLSAREATLSHLDVSVVLDRFPDAGPLAGLDAGLREAGTAWVLAVACDLPDLTSEVLAELLAAREDHIQAVVARTPEGRLQPLCACYHISIAPIVERRLLAGSASFRGLLGELQEVRLVDVPAGPLRNVNAPSDLDR